jgi:lipopolysaccharide transport system ATP-binding protein
MSSLAVRVEGIGKQYQLGLREKRNQTFREAVVDMAAAPWRRLRQLSGRSGGDDTFWALKDISFDVPEGEVLGIIGHNGAGKSTLLKILSRITEPTEGRATIHGRVASLLEVGTGFHNELTGRENVYLNGAILGMSRREIDRKFDEIVDFAGVEKFLDTPIKRYSSGMKVRLAFAVAAHLDPEILIIDEVLAVGDQEFQHKCLGKMQDVAMGGRTVLFVSHNMGAISDLCGRCILLKAGNAIADGAPQYVIRKYLIASEDNPGVVDVSRFAGMREGAGPMQITRIEVCGSDSVKTRFALGEPITFRVFIEARIGSECIIGVAIRNEHGHRVIHLNNVDDRSPLTLSSNESLVTIHMASHPLNTGTYTVSVWLGDGTNICNDCVQACLSFTVDHSEHGQVRSRGLVCHPAQWTAMANRCVSTSGGALA